MAAARPILRIFDYSKAIEFYINWLQFTIDWEYKEKDQPAYLQVSLNGVVLHLTEHHGDCSPGARVHIDDFTGLKTYHAQLSQKNYKCRLTPASNKPFHVNTICMEVTNPFSNRLTFTETLSTAENN